MEPTDYNSYIFSLEGEGVRGMSARSWQEEEKEPTAFSFDAYSKIFSLDGGGVRGIIPARMCEEIETITKTPICKLANSIIGVSVGSLLAAGLTAPKEPGSDQPKYSGENMVDLFKDNADKIFPPVSWYQIPLQAVKSLFTSKWDPQGLYEVVDKYCSNLCLSDCLCEVTIIAAQMSTKVQEPWYFTANSIIRNSNTPTIDPEAIKNIRIADIVKAACSAPTYFPPAFITIDGTKYECIDAGVVANNPIDIGISLHPRHDYGRLLIGSLGTGKSTGPMAVPSAYNSGLLYWLLNYSDTSLILNNAQAKLLAAREIQAGKNKEESQKQIYRFQPEIPKEDYILDDGSKEYLEHLLNITNDYIEKNSDEIASFCSKLKQKQQTP